MFKRMAVVTLVALCAFSVTSLARGENEFVAVSLKTVDEVVIPGWETFGRATAEQRIALDTLCTTPSETAVLSARVAFGTLVAAFGRIEFARFGPAVTDFRFEKLFYWPDRRGRGLRQVRGLLAAQDQTATAAARLSDKSVAVQGLPALEYLLYGEGASELATSAAAYRCAYAMAVAANLQNLSTAIVADWKDAGGHRSLMASPGAENSHYRDGAEVARTVLDAAREQLQLTLEAKLRRPLGQDFDTARPKRAPLWRSRQALSLVAANIAGVRAVFSSGRLDGMIPEDGDRPAEAMELLMEELSRELWNAEDAVREAATLAGAASPFNHEEAWRTLRYATAPLNGALSILSTRYPRSLGMIVGFNALDGD